MDYIKFAIDELERQNEKRGITAGMARQQYSALLSRIAQLEAAQQSVHLTCVTGHMWDDMLNEEGVTIQVCQTCGTRR